MFDPKDRVLSIKVDHQLSNRNDGQGRHWAISNKAKSKLLRNVREAEVFGTDDKLCKLGLTFEFKVDILVTRVLGANQRLWDADSVLRGDCKQLIDSIVSLGILKDDGPKYVGHVLGTQEQFRRKRGPCVWVDFFKSDTPPTSELR